MKETKTIILAAGQGTRMRSKYPKVLHTVCDDTLIGHVIRSNRGANIQDLAVVVGFQADLVKSALPCDVQTYLQSEQRGTGHAVIQALPFFEEFDGNVLVLVGDAPLVRPATLKALIETHESGGFGATVLTAVFDDPTGYGRIIKHGEELIRIVEHKDATDEERKVREINSGMYCFDASALRNALCQLTTNNAQGEYYLTDTIEIIRRSGGKVGSYPTPDVEDIAAVNSKNQLAQVGKIMQRRINNVHMENGVVIQDPDGTYIGIDTVIGRDTLIEPGVATLGSVSIGEDCIIKQCSRLENICIEDRTIVPPFSYLQ